jgi:hypothetical protein
MIAEAYPRLSGGGFDLPVGRDDRSVPLTTLRMADGVE